ncbi:MAG: hypothetical protein GY856_49575 [bacterium]|nr:hypothetical protein [bacterium]
MAVSTGLVPARALPSLGTKEAAEASPLMLVVLRLSGRVAIGRVGFGEVERATSATPRPFSAEFGQPVEPHQLHRQPAGQLVEI